MNCRVAATLLLLRFISLLLSFLKVTLCRMSFPDSSVGRESACNAGDPGLIPGLGRSSGEGKGYPL